MKLNFLVIIIFFFLSPFLCGQSKVHSPFKLTDYENLKKEYKLNNNKSCKVNSEYFKSKVDSLTQISIIDDEIKIICKKKYKYFYSNKFDALYILFNDNLAVIYWFLYKTNKELIGNGKFLNDRMYWNKNGRLFSTSKFILPEKIQVGKMKQFDENGKLTFLANWDNFSLSINEAKKLAKN